MERGTWKRQGGHLGGGLVIQQVLTEPPLGLSGAPARVVSTGSVPSWEGFLVTPSPVSAVPAAHSRRLAPRATLLTWKVLGYLTAGPHSLGTCMASE